MARIDIRLTDEAKAEAEKQADSVGLDLTKYTLMLYKLNFSEAVEKLVDKINDKPFEKEKKKVKKEGKG